MYMRSNKTINTNDNNVQKCQQLVSGALKEAIKKKKEMFLALRSLRA